MATLKNTTINDTGYLTLPVGTTAERPSTAVAGMTRYNTTTSAYEFYDGTAWVGLITSVPVSYLVQAGGAGGGGTVTSVAMTVPTGLTVSGSPITSTGTLAVTLTSGYSTVVGFLNIAGSLGFSGFSTALVLSLVTTVGSKFSCPNHGSLSGIRTGRNAATADAAAGPFM